MPMYLTRFSYTPETWARLVKNPEDRRAAAGEGFFEWLSTTGAVAFAVSVHDGEVYVGTET